MTLEDVSVLLALLGGGILLSSWLGRRGGDAPRDARLMASIGAGLLAAAAGTWIS